MLVYIISLKTDGSIFFIYIFFIKNVIVAKFWFERFFSICFCLKKHNFYKNGPHILSHLTELISLIALETF